MYGVTDGVKAALLASASRSEFGNIEFDAFSYEGLGLIECVGGTYIDEATGLSLTAPAMRAVVPIAEASRHIITPLTELAVSLAEIAGADLRTVVDKYNALIAVEFGLRDINIVNVFPDVSSSTQGRLYAVALAGLSHLDSAEDGTIAETLANLIADLELDEALSKEAKTAFAEALVEYSENDIGEISSILEEILEPSALSDPGVLNYSENAANSEFVFENAGGGLISACSSDALQNIGLNVAPTPDGSSCVISGTPNQVIPNRTYSITVTNVAGTSSVDVQVVITARFDAVEKALTDGHADDVSIEQLVNYIKEKNTEQVASCQAVVDVVYPSGAYPETDVIIDTSRSNNYASTIPENTVVQSSLNANITWVGKQENTNRYAVFGYNAFDYKDFPSTLGGSTTKILEWVLNLGEGVDIFSQPLVVVTNSGSAARDLNPWLATNAPGHRWTVTSDLSALNSGNYDLFFNIFGRGGESTLAHQQPLLTDQKPVIAYNADYIPGVEDLADFGLELIGRANDHYINLGLAS
ncbi:MAG: hypothetical protein GWP50_02790, partial [Proteobacteria bacterium]|nr:hypothetical protein [Pseudomonadota bacterium]